MTFYCRIHPDWEGADLGKIFDHTEKQHPELLTDLPIGAISEYRKRYQRLLKEDFFEIEGPNRLSDTQWLQAFHGRFPKMASQVATNDMEKK